MAYITLDELKECLPIILSDWIEPGDEGWEWIFQEIEQKCHIGKPGKGKKKKFNKEEHIRRNRVDIDALIQKFQDLNKEVEEMHRKQIDMQSCINGIRLDVSQTKSMAEIAKNRTQVDYSKYTGYTKGSEAQIIQNVYNRMVNRGATREELDNFKAVIKKYDATNYQPSNNFSYTDGKTAKEVKEIIDCMRCKHYCGDGAIKEPCIGCADYDCWEAKDNG